MSLRAPFLLVVSIFLVAVSVLHADSWVASSGTIDEGDLSKVVLNNDGSATIRSTISSTSAKIRFNVVPTAENQPPPPGTVSGGLLFTMRSLDNGSGARVIATLKRVVLAGFHPEMTQRTDVIATIDSDLAPASTQWQTVWAQSSDPAVFQDNNGLTFLNYGYVVEVELIKHDSTGTPGVMGVQLFRDET